MPTHPLFQRLRERSGARPLVVAHRGDSANHPENTLAAFVAARELGVVMQEFDVQVTRDGVVVCLHDDGLDRTTDAATRLGPGARLEHCDWQVVRTLDAGRWRGAPHAGERIPTLEQALAVMLPHAVPMIEHKAGDVGAILAVLRSQRALGACIVQAFDWRVVAAVHQQAPEAALAALGPNPAHPRLDEAALAAARACGAGMVHWQDRDVCGADVTRAHAAGLLVCTYTTDDELGWAGGRALGIDAMCTNDPGGMLRWQRGSLA